MDEIASEVGRVRSAVSRGGLPDTIHPTLCQGGSLSIAYISIEATKWVWNESKSTGQARLVLLAIASHCNADGWSWPSLKTIEEACYCSRPTVLRCLDWLEEFGEIQIERGGQGPGSTHRYFLRGFVERVKKGKEIEAKGKVEPDLRVKPIEPRDSPEVHEAERITVENWLISDSQNKKNLEEERLEEETHPLPLSSEPGRPQPKPVKEPKVRKGFQKTLPPKREYVPAPKPPETWNWFAAMFHRYTKVLPLSRPEHWETFDKLYSDLSATGVESRFSQWYDQRGGKITAWSAVDFLNECMVLPDKEGDDIASVVNEE